MATDERPQTPAFPPQCSRPAVPSWGTAPSWLLPTRVTETPLLSQACEPGLEAGLAGASGAERAVEKVPQHYEPFAPMGL